MTHPSRPGRQMHLCTWHYTQQHFASPVRGYQTGFEKKKKSSLLKKSTWSRKLMSVRKKTAKCPTTEKQNPPAEKEMKKQMLTK